MRRQRAKLIAGLPHLRHRAARRAASGGRASQTAHRQGPQDIARTSSYKYLDNLSDAEQKATGAKIHAYSEEIIPLRRWGTAGEIAKTIVWLASDDASYITGTTILAEVSGVILRGVPDLICRRRDGALAILDNKTARYTDGQDALAPLYETQLNAYA